MQFISVFTPMYFRHKNLKHPLCKHPLFKHPLCKHPLRKHPLRKHPLCKRNPKQMLFNYITPQLSQIGVLFNKY